MNTKSKYFYKVAGECKHCGRWVKTGMQCNTCSSRRKRERNPVRYAYDTLKANCARRKGAGWFELTFAEFVEFCHDFDYIAGKGRTVHSYTVDCKDPTMGYFVGNIRPMQNGDNSRKRRKFLNYEWSEQDRKMIAFLTTNEPPTSQNDDPF